MEEQGKFCLKKSIIIGCAWCLFSIIAYFSDMCGKTLSDLYGLPILISVHSAFFIFFICSILYSYMAFAQQSKFEAEEELKEKEYKRKEKWEKFKFEQNNEREDNEIIKKLKDEKSALEKELKKYEDATIAERETKTQAFHLLALALSDQNVFADNKTIEEKLKQIEKDYELLKKTIKNIKL